MTSATAQPKADQSQVELARRMLRQMLLIRRFEEKAAEAYALGKIGGVPHPYIGGGGGGGGAPPMPRPDATATSADPAPGPCPAKGAGPQRGMAGRFARRRGAPPGRGGG